MTSLATLLRAARAADKAEALLKSAESRLAFFRGEMKYLAKNQLACLGWLADGTAIDSKYLASEIASIQENIAVYRANYNRLHGKMYDTHTAYKKRG